MDLHYFIVKEMLIHINFNDVIDEVAKSDKKNDLVL